MCTQEVYGPAESHFITWRKELHHHAGNEALSSIQELQQERAHLEDLRADLASLRKTVEATKRLAASGARMAEAMGVSEDYALERAQAVANARDELLRQEARHAQELDEARQLLISQEQVAETRHVEALKLIGTYENRLGLAISREDPQTVKVTFLLLDKEREFSFILSAASDSAAGEYHVSGCSPEVGKLPVLLAELNETRTTREALPRFLCAMRRAFQESITTIAL